MNFLDIRTVLFGHLVTDSLCTIVLVFLWLQNQKRHPGLLFWVINFIFQTAGALLLILRGIIPDWMSVGLSNPMVLAGAFMGFVGVKRFLGEKSSQVPNILLAGGFIFVHFYFTFFQQNLDARNLNVALGLLVICAQCAWFMLRGAEPGRTRMTRGIGWVYTAFCLVSVIRILTVLTNPQDSNDLFQSGLFDRITLQSYQILLILLTFGLVLMINRRLVMDVTVQEEKFIKAFDSSPSGILISRHSDGLILDANRSFTKITGYLPGEAVGRTMSDLSLWVNEADRLQALDELSTQGEVQGWEFQFQTKSGRRQAGLLDAEILLVENEKLVFFSISDITERKQALEKLRDSEAKYRSLIESSNSAIVTTDMDGRIHFVNRIAALQLGGEPAALTGKFMTELFPAEIAASQLELVQQVITNNEGLVVELPSIVNNQARWYLTNIQPIRDHSGQASLAMVNAQDITERKQAEETRRESEERYRSLFENMLNGFAYCQMIFEGESPQDFIFLDVNRTFETLTGLKNVVGKRVTEAIPGIRESDPQMIEIYGRVALTGQPEIFETYIKSLNMWFSISAYSPQQGFFVTVFDVITSRKQSEEKLLEDKARLHLALDAAKGGAWEWDLQTNENFWSEELWKVYGLEPFSCEPSYEAWLQTIHPQDREGASGAVAKAAREAVELNAEWRVCDPDGTERWLMSRGQPILDATGQAIRFIGTVLDITGRVHAEQALRESEEKFRKAILTSPDAINITRLSDGEYITANNGFSMMLGYQASEVIGKTSLDLNIWVNPEDRKGWAAALAAQGDFLNYEARFRAKNGEIRDGLTSASVFELGGIPHVMSITRDISERKKTEEKLRRSEDLFSKSFQSSPAPMTIARRTDGIYIEVNESFLDLVECSREEAIGHTSMDLNLIDADGRAEIFRQLRLKGSIHNVEVRAQTKTGKRLDVLTSIENVEMGGEACTICSMLDITERKQAEELLRQSEERYRTVADYTYDWEYWRSNNGKMLYTSPSCERITGHTVDEFMEDPDLVDLIVHPEDQVFYNEHRSSSNQGGEDQKVNEADFRILRPDGEVRWIGHTCQTIYRADGTSLGIRATNRDITERRQIEELAVQNRAKLETALHSMIDAVFISDVQGLFIDFNDAFVTYHRFNNREECRKTFAEYPDILDVFLPDGTLAPVEMWPVPRALNGETVTNAEYILRRKDTQEQWVGSYNFAPLRDSGGVIVGSVVVARDITDRKREEEEIQKLNAELEQRVLERTAELSDLYNNAPCGYHSLDRDGTFIHINDTELKWLGYTREELLGKMRALDLITPESQAVFAQNFPILKKRGWIKDVELHFIRKNGTILPLLISATAILDHEGNYHSSRTTLIDYSGLKQAEEALNQSHQKLTLVNKELESFAYSVSHDLRAPLRGIDGWSLALLEDYHDRLDAQGQKYLERVRSETRRMGQLIDDLLQLSRMTRAEMQIKRVDLSRVAQTVVDRLAAGRPIRQVEIVIQPGLTASGDMALLEIVLTNLLDNAWKFTGKLDSARIEFGQTEARGNPAFFVRDNGTGFDMAYAEKLFGAFQRLHKTTDFPGTGIGLATVQRIINRHGGRVWVEAQVDQGATFYFTIGDV